MLWFTQFSTSTLRPHPYNSTPLCAIRMIKTISVVFFKLKICCITFVWVCVMIAPVRSPDVSVVGELRWKTKLSAHLRTNTWHFRNTHSAVSENTHSNKTPEEKKKKRKERLTCHSLCLNTSYTLTLFCILDSSHFKLLIQNPLPPEWFHYLHFLFLIDPPVGFGAFVPSTPLPLPALLVYLCTQILA